MKQRNYSCFRKKRKKTSRVNGNIVITMTGYKSRGATLCLTRTTTYLVVRSSPMIEETTILSLHSSPKKKKIKKK